MFYTEVVNEQLQKPFFVDTRNKESQGTFLYTAQTKRFVSTLDQSCFDVLPITKKGIAEFANTYFGCPSNRLIVIGVTGTNGKTSTVYYLKQALEALGKHVLSIGTLTHQLTTPDSWELQQLFLDHVNAGGSHVVMEVSSHGIDQCRVLGLDFNVTLLTNISQDHLDYHHSMQAYEATKLGFMAKGRSAAIFPEDFELVELPFAKQTVFQSLNMKATKATLLALGFSVDKIDTCLQTLSDPPGRFEFIQQKPFEVVVDYAHSPDGLYTVLKEAKHSLEARQGRLICVFGCGGDRDKSKRPLMGQYAELFSDYVVVSSDNPRSESMSAIANDILAGMKEPSKAYVELDRKKAIAYALGLAKDHDLVLIAGKGHETYQLIGEDRLVFDDRCVVKELLKASNSHQVSKKGVA